MKKPDSLHGAKINKPLVMSAWSESFPMLWDYLTTSVYDGGESRLTSSLTIFVQDGVLKACVNDRDLDRSAFFTGETMEDLLISVDDSLREDDCDWRVKRGTSPQNKPPF